MDLQHVVFQLNFENLQYKKITNSNATSDLYFQNIGSNLPIRSEIFFELFPFHVVFKRDLEIISVGESLKQAMKHAEGESVRDVFNLLRPLMNFTWENVSGKKINFEMILTFYNNKGNGSHK
jgi:guanylate cyclase